MIRIHTLVLLCRLGIAVMLGALVAVGLLWPRPLTPEGLRARRRPLFAALAVMMLGLTMVPVAATLVLHRIARWRALWGGHPWVGRVLEGLVALLALGQLAVAVYAARRSLASDAADERA